MARQTARMDSAGPPVHPAGMTEGPQTAPTPPAHDAELDALGLLCPLPVLKARKRLQALSPGQVLRVEADDPAAVIDMPHFCAESGHELLEMTEAEAPRRIYYIRRG